MKSAEDQIADGLLFYRKNHPKKSKVQVAKDLGLCITTFNRLLNRKFDKKTVRIIDLREAMTKVFGSKGIIDEIILNDKDLKSNVERNIPYLLKKKTITPNEDTFKYVFEKKARIHTFITSTMRNGTTIEEMKRICGDEGVKAIYDLVHFKIITVNKENKYVPFFYSYDDTDQNDFATFTRYWSKLTMLELIERCDTSREDGPASFLGFHCQRWKLHFFPIAKSIINKAIEQVIEQGSKEENIGDIPGFVGAFLDTYQIDLNNNINDNDNDNDNDDDDDDDSEQSTLNKEGEK